MSKHITSRTQQLARAMVRIAKANHYMVGLVEPVTADELDGAEQLLITRQNNASPDAPLWQDLELALDLIAQARGARNA